MNKSITTLDNAIDCYRGDSSWLSSYMVSSMLVSMGLIRGSFSPNLNQRLIRWGKSLPSGSVVCSPYWGTRDSLLYKA